MTPSIEGALQPRTWSRVALVLLAAAFFLRCAFLDLALPYGDPLDEPFHYAYASFVAQTGRFPRAAELSIPMDALRPLGYLPRSTTYGPPPVPWKEFLARQPSERNQLRRLAYRYVETEREGFVGPNFQSQHPPLFYIGAAAILRLLPRNRVDTRLLALRIFASICAAAAIPLVHRFFRRMLPQTGALAGTAAVVAMPGLSSLVGRFTNDALAAPLAAGLLVLLVDASRGLLDGRRSFALALTLAAGCWTKLYFLPLLPAAAAASLFAPRRRRKATFVRAALAAVIAFSLFLPWLERQHRDTGDWLGLAPSKTAESLHIGILARIAAVPDLFHARYVVVLGRTFLWPGTGSAMGAPAAMAVLLVGALLVSWMLPGFSTRPISRRVRRGGLAAATALVFFMIAELLYSGTYAAVARARGLAAAHLGLGWYAAILTPAVLVAGCVFGRAAPARAFLAAVAVALPVSWAIDLGVLPGVYSGEAEFNGSNVSLASYARWILFPWAAMRTYAAVALVPISSTFLGLLWFCWQGMLGLGVWLGVASRDR